MTDQILKGYLTQFQLPVLWGDMDAYGHVNNSVYFRWFEHGRGECLVAVDAFDLVNTTGVGLILAGVSARFKGQIKHPDTAIIGTRIMAAERSKLVFEHAIASRAAGKIVATGESTMVAFDFAAGRLVRLPEKLCKLVKAVPSSGTAAEG